MRGKAGLMRVVTRACLKLFRGGPSFQVLLRRGIHLAGSRTLAIGAVFGIDLDLEDAVFLVITNTQAMSIRPIILLKPNFRGFESPLGISGGCTAVMVRYGVGRSFHCC
jgi:hypothetical protein